MKKIYILTIAIIFHGGNVMMAQNFDPKRMERDIEVAENILGTLLNEGNVRSFWIGSIEGKYVQDYGVIITLPNNTVHGARSYTYRSDNKDVVVLGGDVVSVNIPKVEATVVNMDSLNKVQREKTVEGIKLFLADYGNLISQLKPDQKIMITNRNNNFRWSVNNEELNELSAEVKMEDLGSFKSGKLSRNQLMDRITITNRTRSENKSTDLELLSSIMGRLYRSDLSNTYYTNSTVYYDRLPGFGAIYRMQVYSSTNDGDLHRIITRDAKDLTQEQRNEIVKKMYPEFITSLKENILEYGRTVNSLKDDEILMFQVTMTKCVGCNLPKELEVSVKNKVLQDYSAGKISRVDALKSINIREGELQ